MKIKPFNKKIKEVNNVSIGDIPLSYVSNEETSYTPMVEMMPEFIVNKKTRLEPYKTFPTDQKIFFDNNGKPVKSTSLKRQGNTYTYMPKGMSEFTPLHFSVNALARRTMTYRSSKNYNFNVAAIETDVKDTLALSKKLMTIFGDAYKRGIAPANITINNGDKRLEVLACQPLINMDFIFVESKNGEDLKEIQINKLIDEQHNVWISAETFGKTMLKRKNDNPKSYHEEGYINSCFVPSQRKRLSNYVFSQEGELPKAFKDYSNRNIIYEDVMLLENVGRGTLIVTPKDFLDNASKNIKVIYDVMMHLYFTSFFTTKTLSTWITDYPVCKIASLNTAYGKTHGSLKLSTLVHNKNASIDDEYQLIRVNTEPTNVVFIGVDENGDLLFKKAGGIPDPEIPKDAITFLASNGNVIIYKPEKIYSMEMTPKIECFMQDNEAIVKIAPYSSTDRMTYISKETMLKIEDIHEAYYICLDSSASTKEFKLINKNTYSQRENGSIVAQVSIDIDYHTKAYDIRQLGGGLPLACKDDYSLEDIGNAYGRPYRVGSTVIITLPKKCKPYEKQIWDAINLHIAAGEKAILRFV